MTNLMEFYKNKENLNKMMCIINGESKISLRIVDWFVTNYAKKHYTIIMLPSSNPQDNDMTRFKVYNDYKLKLKAYAKKRFDPFCRWERISVPFSENVSMETTIGQLNFFKWSIENRIIDYIEQHYQEIEEDMNDRNSTSKRRTTSSTVSSTDDEDTSDGKMRKKREELSVSACKCIKKENVKIIVKFN
uniref:Uncharacterized protein n=1 Tax=viral metagenome TaxID=1070528 RepID=A0A6C0I4Q7_9ZZZZ